ncbi:RnaseH, partial [Salmonella enterica subsp. enterica serovar Bareilly]
TKILKGDRKDGVASVRVRGDFWFTRVDGERTPSMKTSIIEAIANDRSQAEVLLSAEEYKRYQENLVLIDFDYIPDNIASTIIEYYNSYQPQPKGKIYSYFVKSGLSKLTSVINEF